MRSSFTRAALVLLAGLACEKSPGGSSVTDPGTNVPQWHFVRMTLPASALEATVTGVWANSLNEVYAVGWNGVILTNRKGGVWERMTSPVGENLTAIYGVENGQAFGLPAAHGEMFAVGWHGTVLHYHPNPDANALTDDGVWQVVAAPGQGRLSPLLKPDPACPDFDGDGIADDGNGDGWVGNLAGVPTACGAAAAGPCDDNCRTSANGVERPLTDTNQTTAGDRGCLGPGDLPLAALSQADGDGDGVGLVCDDNDTTPEAAADFDATLMTVWARASGNNVSVIAMGEDGSLVVYQGPAAGQVVAPTAFPITDPRGWLAQTTLAFTYANDNSCGAARGDVCTDSGRLPPSCPAQCNPRKSACPCPPGTAQCCDATAPTGAGCGDGSCGAVPNVCTGTTCSVFCPDCFRHLTETVRAVTVEGSTIFAVGASGTIVFGDLANPMDVWRAPGCTNPPKPLDDAPLLTAVRGNNGAVHVVGAAGAIFRVTGGSGDCPVDARAGAPQVFLSAVHATSGNTAYAVGDGGLFLYIDGGRTPQVESLDADTKENLLGIWETTEEQPETNQSRTYYWLVGAKGTILRAGYY